MFGEDTMERLKNDEIRDYFDLLRAFEMSKRNELPDSTKTINFRMPVSLREFYTESNSENIVQKIQRMDLKNEVNFKRDTFRVSPDVVRS